MRVALPCDGKSPARQTTAQQELPASLGRRTSAAMRLWPAWRALDEWEGLASDELGGSLGELLVLLWSVRRLLFATESLALFNEFIDEELHPEFSDPLLEDIVEVAFALGAAWANDRSRGGGVLRLPVR